MIKINLPFQFGYGILNYRYLVDYTDLTSQAGSAATLKLGTAAGVATVVPQGSLVLGSRLKPLVKPAGTSLSQVAVTLGWDNTITQPGSPVTTANAILTSTNTFVTVADSAFTTAILTSANAPGDTAFNLTATFTQTGASGLAALTAGQWMIDVIIFVYSQGELPTSQYYTSTPGVGQP